MKDALRHDRARIQVGRISHFGLLEMSRQRLRTGVLEGSTSQCPHCQGTGIVRSTESVALAVLRGIEDELMKGRPSSITALTTAAVALYILNHKRGFIVEIEQRYGIAVNVEASERMQGASFAIERVADGGAPAKRPERSAAVNMEWGFEGEEREVEAPRDSRGDDDGESGNRREGRRRRRRGRGGDRERGDRDRGDRHFSADRSREGDQSHVDRAPGDDVEDVHGDTHADRGEGDEDRGADAPRSADSREGGERGERRRRRRGRRGGRNRERREMANGEQASPSGDLAEAGSSNSDWASEDLGGQTETLTSEGDAAAEQRHEEQGIAHPEAPDERRHRAAVEASYATERGGAGADVREDHREEAAIASSRAEAVVATHAESAHEERPSSQSIGSGESREPEKAAVEDVPPKSDEPPRKGWWQKRFGSA
jgi:ribonuclease E